MISKPLHPTNHSQFANCEQLRDALRKRGCVGCNLGFQKDYCGPVVFRGNPESKKMLVGEAPGMREDIKGIPFTGPAGRILDKMFADVGWDTNKDWYITNTIKCRPVAPRGSGKQNLTPTSSQRASCWPYLEWEISTLKPHTIVLLGGVAAQSVLSTDLPMRDLCGKVFFNDKWPGTQMFVMYHPAYILRAQNDPQKKDYIGKYITAHMALLRQLVDEAE